MENLNACPCPNLKCPNHGNCANCTSRHLRIGTLNYCGFQAILPFLKEVSEISSDSSCSQKIKSMIDRHTNAYAKAMKEHSISEDQQNELRARKANLSKH